MIISTLYLLFSPVTCSLGGPDTFDCPFYRCLSSKGILLNFKDYVIGQCACELVCQIIHCHSCEILIIHMTYKFIAQGYYCFVCINRIPESLNAYEIIIINFVLSAAVFTLQSCSVDLAAAALAYIFIHSLPPLHSVASPLRSEDKKL